MAVPDPEHEAVPKVNANRLVPHALYLGEYIDLRIKI